MVGPSLSEEEHRAANRRLKVGFVLLVAVSAALIAYRADATLVEAGVVVAGALVVAAALLWFVLRLVRQMQPENPRRPRR